MLYERTHTPAQLFLPIQDKVKLKLKGFAQPWQFWDLEPHLLYCNTLTTEPPQQQCNSATSNPELTPQKKIA